MIFYIIIPAHNEADVILATLDSLLKQSLKPKRIVVVDDNSTDNTFALVHKLAQEYENLDVVKNSLDHQGHIPGAKVVKAFKAGKSILDEEYDVLCKFDADLIFPSDYLEKIAAIFDQNPNYGIAGGFCHIKKDGNWQLENLTNQDHIRGALKAYRKACYKEIGGLTLAMGWDTIDEIKAKYSGWQVVTDPTLVVKHLKPTGATYGKKSKFNQGIAFYRMRYRPVLTFLAALKLSLRKRSAMYFLNCILGYCKAFFNQSSFLLTKKEGRFNRLSRYKSIKNKLFK